MKRIMACIDLSEATDEVVRIATDLAKATNARLYIVHVANTMRPPTYLESTLTRGLGEAVNDEIRITRSSLNSIKAHLRENQKLDANVLLLQSNRIAPALLEEAQRIEPDLILVGAHGHGALDRLLGGSTSQAFMQTGKWPVLVVPVSHALAERGVQESVKE